MKHSLRFTPDQLKRFDKMAELGKPLPQSLQNQPELFYDAIPYWMAFNALSSSRQSGMGLGYIPYSEITSYLDDQRIFNLDERDDYRYHITHIDHTFVEIKSAESDKKKSKTPQKKR